MQWLVSKIAAAARDRDMHGAVLVNSSKDYIKGYYTTEEQAIAAAKVAAEASPGEQYGVFSIITIFEALKPARPKVITKAVNSAGEVVVVKEP